MLQDMDITEASCTFFLKVGMVSDFEQSKTSLLTVSTMGIVRLTVQRDLIVRVSFMYYPWDHRR
jgi:hypothetical protein